MLSTVFLMVTQSNPAVIPVSRLTEDWWRDRHNACVEITKRADFDVAFLGDSITQGWEGAGRTFWDKNFSPLKSANFGFSGDRTEHVLWRLDNGEIVGAKPKLIVIMIGTNNIGHGATDASQTAAGVRAIVTKLTSALPATQVLLLATFPRGAGANDKGRVGVSTAVAGFKSVADGKRVHFLDIGPKFVSEDGTIQPAIMPYYLHLSPAGYQIWGDNILPAIKSILGVK